uniref:DEAH-box helicase 35 n=1 Tax=Pavo cristatus TaxID=9049 RepID=A0A8C9FBL1_PAVCR
MFLTYLAEAGWTAEGRVVGVTQPRRVAAVSVAGRVADERGAVLGHEVGYCIRFDDCTDPQATRIKFLTDGMLVREMMADPLLTRYSPVPDYIKSTVETAMKIHQMENDGDILAFLTGQEEVETVVSMLIEQARALSRTGMKKHLRVLPMYAGLPSPDQMKVFERVSRSVRKVIVATNVAETSITIHGIAYVIDCGFVKLRAYNPKTAIECLVVVPVSKASANQRAGRAGRNRSGKCYRLYTAVPRSSVTEASAGLHMCLYFTGVGFCFPQPPPAQSMVQALELLYALGGLDMHCRLTEPLGMRIAEFPLNPMFAKMLLESGNFGCSQEILTIAAMMQIQNIFLIPPNQKSQAARQHRKFAVEEGDHLTMLNVYEAFVKVSQCKRMWICGNVKNLGLVYLNTVLITSVPCLCYKETCFSFLSPRVVYNEVIQTAKYYMRDVTAIESAWLVELAPHFYQQGTVRNRHKAQTVPLLC